MLAGQLSVILDEARAIREIQLPTSSRTEKRGRSQMLFCEVINSLGGVLIYLSQKDLRSHR